MTNDELACEFSRIFDQEWRKSRRWALTQAFAAGVLTAAAISFLSRLI